MRYAYFLFILSMLCTFGCSKKKENNSLASIRPTIIEEVSGLVKYHEKEIQKYEEALLKEKVLILRLLNEHRMPEVRQAYNRKQLYIRKIKEHKRALKKIEGMQNDASQ